KRMEANAPGRQSEQREESGAEDNRNETPKHAQYGSHPRGADERNESRRYDFPGNPLATLVDDPQSRCNTQKPRAEGPRHPHRGEVPGRIWWLLAHSLITRHYQLSLQWLSCAAE